MIASCRCGVKCAGCAKYWPRPLYLANEGKIVAIVPPEQVAAALAALQAHPLGDGAADIAP